MTKLYVAPSSPTARDYCARVDAEFDRQMVALGITEADNPTLINYWQDNPMGSVISTIRADGKSRTRFIPYTRPRIDQRKEVG